MSQSDSRELPTITLRWERDHGLCIRTRLPGDVVADRPVSLLRALPAFIGEVRWLRQALRSGEVVR